MFVSLTRLRLRSVRFLPSFAVYAIQTTRQVKRAPGFQVGQLLPDRSFTFWTMTGWESEEAMRRYMISGAHKRVMPKLLGWCDEASVAHWEQVEITLPSWPEAYGRMRQSGRASKVYHPSPQHATLTFAPPANNTGQSLQPHRS